MRGVDRLIMTVGIVLLAGATAVAQQSFERINSHFGSLAAVPLGSTSDYVSTGWGLVGGVGYNFSNHHSFIGEFLWARLPATAGALQPLREATGISDLHGHSNLYVLTGNYRFEWRERRFGAYVIGGAGLYYRTTNPSALVNSGTHTSCAPAWLWWGFKCTSGTVVAGQTLGSTGSSAFGENVGGGFTVRVGEDPYRLYFESRYHYAPNKNINTHLVTVTFGIRY